jgi:S-adenosylmethionine:tRNA ribosyltransferase-isomerase
MIKLEKLLKQYDYQLPKQLIAQSPAKPRDAARLLVYSKGDKNPRFDTFKNLAKYLPRTNFTKEGTSKPHKLTNQTLAGEKPNSKKLVRGLPKNSVLVFNQTKVWPARLITQKVGADPFDSAQGRPEHSRGGGKVELLYISHDKNHIKVLANKKLPIGTKVTVFLGREKQSPLLVVKKSNQFYYLKPAFPTSQIPNFLKKYGVTPLPPYIKHSPLTEKQKRKQYQSVFAKTGLSVAAPTASLHFTKKLMSRLKKRGIGIAFVNLDVGLGTFAPLKEENIKTGKLHREFYRIGKNTANFLNQAKKQGRPVIAVGTTAVRTLESSSIVGDGLKPSPTLTKLTGQTDLFIREGYKFKFVDGLITNFHVPKSSLIMLVSAFIDREKLLALYQQAINKHFRFFSFGDGMLILPN